MNPLPHGSASAIPNPETDPTTVISRELSGNERLLWAGKPAQGFLLRSSDAFGIPFSLVWTAFACFMAFTAVSGGMPFPFSLIPLLFVAIGFQSLFGRFVSDSMARKHTFYGVTNERIVIISGWFSRRVKSLNLNTLTDVSLTERRDRRGTITFGPESPFGSWAEGMQAPGFGPPALPRFELIPDAKQVYETIRAAQQER